MFRYGLGYSVFEVCTSDLLENNEREIDFHEAID